MFAIVDAYRQGLLGRSHWLPNIVSGITVGGETINFYNISVENRGSLPFTTPVTFDIVMSPSPALNTAVTLLNKGTFGSFGTHTYSVFSWSAKVPRVADCSEQYFGASIPSDPAWGERFENNNTVAFSKGTPGPTPIQIRLASDPGEPNNSEVTATPIPPNFYAKELSLEHDTDWDYYRFTLTSTQSVLISAEFDHSLGNIDLALSGANLGFVHALDHAGRWDEEVEQLSVE